MKKILCILLAVIFVTCILTACATSTSPAESSQAPSEQSSEAATTKEAKKLTIAFDCAAYTDLFCKLCADAAIEYVETMPNVELISMDGKLDPNVTIGNLELLISKNVDGIIEQPINGTGPGIKKVVDANIPIVCQTILPTEDVQDLDWVYVGTQEENVGILQGEYLAEKLPQGAKVCIILGMLGASNTNGRRAGLQQALFDKRPDIEILDEQAADWDTAKAMAITEDWIQKFPKIDAIITHSDQMLFGAIEALKAANRLTDTITVGMDANETGRTAIKAGEITFSVFQDPVAQTKAAVDTLLKMINGEKVDKYVWVPLVPVTIDNVDEIG